MSFCLLTVNLSMIFAQISQQTQTAYSDFLLIAFSNEYLSMYDTVRIYSTYNSTCAFVLCLLFIMFYSLLINQTFMFSCLYRYLYQTKFMVVR